MVMRYITGKIFVIEALAEPSSEFPEGRHRNHSAFVEGRAVLVTLTKPVSSISTLTNVEKETDRRALDRFSELAVCSNFQRVEYDDVDHAIGACVAKKFANHVKKRSLLSRNRRSGEVHHPSVKSILLKVG